MPFTFKQLDVLDFGIQGSKNFKEVMTGDMPVLIKGVDIGPCCKQWTPEYLMSKLKQAASIHYSTSPILSFMQKNFKYRTMNLDEMISKSIENSEEKYYLRSLGRNARVNASNFIVDYPSISNDFKIPEFLIEDSDFKIHSSVLRISSPNLTLWTHYDVYDNILVQVTGRKSVILFPPSDAKYLCVVGDKSMIPEFNSPIEVLSENYPSVKYLSGYKVSMEKGDILFIPNYWWHSVTSHTFSVGVNIFWSNSELSEFYDKKDVYGNKDPVPAAMASASLEKCIQNLKQLPVKHRKFYSTLFMGQLQKLAD